MERTIFYLTSERLEVELSAPGGAYRGSRFDWTGHVVEATLDGKHCFCAAESLAPGQGSGGLGICGEFGLFTPIGFDETAPGESFPKLGVGLLTRPDEQPYSFMRPYAIEPYPIEVKAGADCAVFVAEPVDCRGYAVRYEKAVSLSANVLTISYRLRNVGDRPIVTEEYEHNFLAVDGQPIGPDYALRLSRPFRAAASMPGCIEARTDGIGWTAAPTAPFYARMDIAAGAEDGYRWELLHKPSGVRVSETVDFAPSAIALWGDRHVVSPEVFIALALRPGEERAWTRRYEFN